MADMSTWKHLYATVTTPGTPVAFAAAETNASAVIIQARKADGANTGDVYIGTSSVDKATDQQIVMAAGDTIVLDGQGVRFIDLSEWYIDCEAGNTDGVSVLYNGDRE